MDEQIKYEELYRNIIGQMELMHKDNLKRLKIGFRCILIVPTIFLLLLLFTQSSKVVFLILWIVSMFIIAAYLIGVEYSDYKLQARINDATDNEGAQTTTLMAESIEENRNAMHDLLMREESRLPFKFGMEQKDKDLDAAEYDTGDADAFSPEAAANAFEAYAADFDDADFGAAGLSCDDYDTLPEESGAVLSAGTLPDGEDADAGTSYLPGSENAEAEGFPIFDIDDDMDDLETLLSADDLTVSPAPVADNLAAEPLQKEENTAENKPEAELNSGLVLDDILSEYHNDFFAPEELKTVDTDVSDENARQDEEFEESRL